MQQHQYYYHDCPNRLDKIGLLIINYINNIEYYYSILKLAIFLLVR